MSGRRSRIQDQAPQVATGAVAITPSNSEAVDFAAIYVGGGVSGGATAGDVVCSGQDGVSVTFKNCPIGFIIPMAVILVASTGTTATSLVGFK